MLVCVLCGKVLKECCDIFHEVVDEEGNEYVVCGECALKNNLQFEDEGKMEKEEEAGQ